MIRDLISRARLFTSASCCKAYSDRKELLRSMWKNDKKLLFYFLSPLAALSFPIASIHLAWCYCWRRPTDDKDRANVIDAWHVGSLVLWLAFLFFVAPQLAKSPWRWLLLLPMLRVADVLYTLMEVVGRLASPRDPARALVLAIVHYSEFVVIFACAYLAYFFPTSGASTACLHGTYSETHGLFPLEFLYFSIVTAATVGYGEIHVVASPDCTATRLLIMVEPMVFLLVTALLIPRAVAKVLNPPAPKAN